MRRRDFLKTTANGSVALPLSGLSVAGLSVTGAVAGAALPAMAQAGSGIKTAQAMAFFNQVIADHDASFSGPDWKLDNPDDLAEARIMLMHTLNHALDIWLHADAARPVFKRWHYPEKKLLGDNPNSIYFDSPASAEFSYRISGNIAGASYTSFTVEVSRGGGASGQLGAVLNDDDFHIEADGSYEIIASVEKPKGKDVKNWLPLASNAISITTRHYFDTVDNVSADRLKHIPLLIENRVAPGPKPRETDAEVAANIMRAANWLKATVFPPSGDRSPHWVSRVPNQFSPPKLDDTNQSIGYAAKDNTYAMARFDLAPDEALIIRGKWPKCRFASVVMQNLFMQSLDYIDRQVSLNRPQTVADSDGRFEMIVAHQDPGKPNWLDTEGRQKGVMFWRFQLIQEPIEPLTTELVKFSEIAG